MEIILGGGKKAVKCNWIHGKLLSYYIHSIHCENNDCKFEEKGVI